MGETDQDERPTLQLAHNLGLVLKVSLRGPMIPVAPEGQDHDLAAKVGEFRRTAVLGRPRELGRGLADRHATMSREPVGGFLADDRWDRLEGVIRVAGVAACLHHVGVLGHDPGEDGLGFAA